MTPEVFARLVHGLIAACFIVGLMLVVAETVRMEQRGLARVSRLLAVIMTVFATVAWSYRWYVSGHIPLFGTYESGLSLTTAVLGVALAWEIKTGGRVSVLPMASLIAGGILLHACRFDATIYPLTISEQSLVVDFHAFCAWIAMGFWSASAALSVRLCLGGDDAEKKIGRWFGWSIQTGFLAHSAMMASGALYRFLLFGSAWSFDPMETMGLTVWLGYGTLLHLRLLGRWPDRRIAAWNLFLFVLLLLSYRLIVYFPAWSSYHILDLNLRIHVT